MLHISTDVPRVRNEFFFRIPYCTSILCFPVLFLNLIFVSVLEQQFILLFYTFKRRRPTCRLPLSYLYFSLHNCLNVNTAVLFANTSKFASTGFASYFFFSLSFYFFIRTFCLYTLFSSTSFYTDNKLLSLSLHKRTLCIMDKRKKNTMRSIYKKRIVAIYR